MTSGGTQGSAKLSLDELRRLAELARLELSSEEEQKFLADFQKILAHFEELKELAPRPAQIKARRVVLREDGQDLPDHFSNQEKIRRAFPEKEQGHLRVPPIFE